MKKAIAVDVKDTGSGIPDAWQTKVFEPFFTSKADGTGLGLFVSAQIVKSHRGIIALKSREGKGSLFSVCLPLR